MMGAWASSPSSGMTTRSPSQEMASAKIIPQALGRPATRETKVEDQKAALRSTN